MNDGSSTLRLDSLYLGRVRLRLALGSKGARAWLRLCWLRSRSQRSRRWSGACWRASFMQSCRVKTGGGWAPAVWQRRIAVPSKRGSRIIFIS